MSSVSIALLSEEHEEALFQFESENRAFFEQEGFSRSPAYYDRESFRAVMEELLDEQARNTHALYLVFTETGELVGRVNLVQIMQEPFRKAELGYRIAKDRQGKGYASEAVRLLIEKAGSSYGLHRLEAGTASQNAASRKVLEKNGFRYVGTYEQYILTGQHWADSALYEIILTEE